jgi:uncharacterized protein (TIGR02284 family)
MDIEKIIGVATRHAILVECERGEDAALESYRMVIFDELPVPTGDLVRMQLAAIQRVRDRIRTIRDAVVLK